MKKLIALSVSVVAVVVTIGMASSLVNSVWGAETIPPTLKTVKVAGTLPPDPNFIVLPKERS